MHADGRTGSANLTPPQIVTMLPKKRRRGGPTTLEFLPAEWPAQWHRRLAGGIQCAGLNSPQSEHQGINDETLPDSGSALTVALAAPFCGGVAADQTDDHLTRLALERGIVAVIGLPSEQRFAPGRPVPAK